MCTRLEEHMRIGWLGALAAVVVACGNDDSGGASPTQGGSTDAGVNAGDASADAGLSAGDVGSGGGDAGSTAGDTVGADAAAGPDAGAGPDAASPTDAGAPVDAGTSLDAGPSLDVGPATDVGGDASACPGAQPPGTTCNGQTWVCKDGYFKPYGGGDCTEATCDNLTQAKNAAIDAVLLAARTCTGAEPEECVVVATTTACGGTCGEAVNAGMANDLAKVVGWIDDNLCKPFDFPAKCGYTTPKCMAPKPTCVKGQCAYMP
jgi:hypothetical protein